MISQTKSMGIILGLLAFGTVSCSSTSVKPSTVKQTTARTATNIIPVSIPRAPTRSCQNPVYETLKMQWSNGLTVHKGTMRLNGCKGSLTVSFWDSESRKTARVQQRIKVGDSSMGLMFYGYNPVYPNTSIKYPNYAADNFLFQQSTNGKASAYVCDDVKQCSPIQLID